MSGADGASVVAKWLPVTTPLQDLLLRMSWLDGTRELYQPIDAPELRSGWTTVRQCTDRLAKMDAFLGERGITGGRYLDVASCYGWFVARMGERGFDAEGVERDPLAVPLGRAVYGLPDGVVSTGDCVDFLRGHPCTDCGETDPVVLEFDHVRGTKRFEISRGITDRSFESLMLEMAKCEVVCANCHRRRTAQRAGYARAAVAQR